MSAREVITRAVESRLEYCHDDSGAEYHPWPPEVALSVLDALAAARYVVLPAAQLQAFAMDCVAHGDMTPNASRMLHRILAAAGGVVEP